MEKLTKALCTVLPASTVLEHLRRQRIPKESGGKVDLSDLHRRGELASYLEGAAWRR
jgi:hypothetical protein